MNPILSRLLNVVGAVWVEWFADELQAGELRRRGSRDGDRRSEVLCGKCGRAVRDHEGGKPCL